MASNCRATVLSRPFPTTYYLLSLRQLAAWASGLTVGNTEQVEGGDRRAVVLGT